MKDKKAKLQLELEKIETQEKKKRKKWHMYEDAECSECNKSGIYVQRNNSGACGYSNRLRCDCTYIKTKRYKKALNNEDISVRDYKKKLKKFYDNNSHYKNEYGDEGRSWND